MHRVTAILTVVKVRHNALYVVVFSKKSQKSAEFESEMFILHARFSQSSRCYSAPVYSMV